MSKTKYQWPDEFYYYNAMGIAYIARKNVAGRYNIYSLNKHESALRIDISVSDFENAFETGAIKIITENCPILIKETPQRSISIDVTAAHAAAKFDVANNPYKPNSSVPDVEREINRLIREVYDLAMKQEEFEYLYTGTASYTVVFQPEDENYGTITVLVSPNVGAGYYDDALEYLEQVGA